MLERSGGTEKAKKCSNSKPRMLTNFAKLFHVYSFNLPIQLKQLTDRNFPENDGNKNCSNKVRVILKVHESKDSPSCVTINKSQNCIGLIDPTPSRRNQSSNGSVNLFPFDSVLTDSDSMANCSNGILIDSIIEFMKGKDTCIFSFGHSALGKTKSMIGSDQSIAEIGIIPCALLWIFKSIEMLNASRRPPKYSVKMSALEIGNKNNVRDLLAGCSGTTADHLLQQQQDNPNALLSSQIEIPVANLLEAARVLDAALAARSTDNESLTHLQLIIHLCQQKLEPAVGPGAGDMVAAAARKTSFTKSKFYFLDLGSGRHGNDDPNILSLQGMAKVILALYTSQLHIPYKDNVMTQLLKESLNLNLATIMLLHITNKEQNYNETLQVVQLAYKLYRTRARKTRSVSFSVSDETSSCSSSSSGFHSRRLRPHMGIGAARRSSGGNSSASSELDFTSASELSCCETVIFVGDPNNNNGSDNSSGRLSSKQRKQKILSSDSDIIYSDKEVLSSSTSPSAIRRRRTSPRTNARAWPTPPVKHVESGPELWVDGPNAVYKTEDKTIEVSTPVIPKKITAEISESMDKKLMVSKETQCEEVWDSGSSLTDGSSYSNTLDRKESRPLSDISECTEESESRGEAAIESEFAKFNLIDQISPNKELDDLLETAFGLNTSQQDDNFLITDSERAELGITQINKTLTETLCIPPEPENPLVQQSNSSKADNTKEADCPVRRHSSGNRKHCHSSSESKRSGKTEQKDKKCKSRCKKCSRKAEEKRSNSMTSSSSTDFSRVESWIQNVEKEIKLSPKDLYKEEEPFYKHYKIYNFNENGHHHSQPDISFQQDPFDRHTNYLAQPYAQYRHPHSAPWMPAEGCQAHYSLYDGYNRGSMNPPVAQSLNIPPGDISCLPIQSLHPQVPCAQHVSVHQSYQLVRPQPSPSMNRSHAQSSNISFPRSSVCITQPPLPPLPPTTNIRDAHPCLNDSLKTQHTQDSWPSSTNVAKPKCKTLPRDVYSDPVCPLKRNQSEMTSSKPSHLKRSIRNSAHELKCKEKFKKEHKNIISILFAPFINLKNRIKTKSSNEKLAVSPDSGGNISHPRSDIAQHVSSEEWPVIHSKIETDLILSSPYHLLTPPKTSILPTESSGHGSDSSSLHNRVSSRVRTGDSNMKSRHRPINSSSKNISRQRPTSSGYGSIIIKGDSEVSSHNDSSSEYSASGPIVSKVFMEHGRMKQSVSLSNCKLPIDSSVKFTTRFNVEELSNIQHTQNAKGNQNIRIAENLLCQEKLRVALNEERKIVIQLIETNRHRGLPVDASVMNLTCFKGVDNFEVNSPVNKEKCLLLISQVDEEIEQLKEKLFNAQQNLLLITSFDSKSLC